MTLKEIYKELSALGMPCAYSHFDDVPQAPYLVFYTNGSDNFGADGEVYYPVTELRIELYSDKKDLEAEKKIEDWLKEKELFYQKNEIYIESEKYICETYEINIGGI